MFQDNQDISSAYESYLQYFRETFPTIPPPSFQSWLQLYNIPQQQQHLPSYQTIVPEQRQLEKESDVFSDNSEPCSSHSSSTSGKTKRERWSQEQTITLVESWKANFRELETSKQQSAWLKIKQNVDKAGPAKTLKQIKTKLKNLKGYL